MTEGLHVVREMPAPPDAVWREWTTPEAFADWFGGAASEVVDVVLDVRDGGTWSATMFAGSSRREIRWAGEYLMVDPPHRLRLTMTDEPDAPARELVTVTLRDLGDGRTEMTLEQTGGMTPAQYRAAAHGWGAFLDRMAARLVA